MKIFPCGIDNYSLNHLGLMPVEMIKWASERGIEGVAFSRFDDETRDRFTSSYLRDLKKRADDLGMYIEWGNGQHVPMDLTNFSSKEIYLSNRRAVGEAYGIGVSIIWSCSQGLMRWKKDSPSTGLILRESARELKKEASLFRDNGVILAIETHYDFTTSELLALFDMCEVEPGDYLGICLDTMNLLTMLEDPVMATERILPWVVSTHFKDGGIMRDRDSLISFPASVGTGVIDLEKIASMLFTGKKQINLSVEDHGGSFTIPIGKKWFIEKFPDLSGSELGRIYELCDLTASRMKNGALKVTGPEEWSSVYEERISSDICKLKAIRDRIIESDARTIQV